MNYKETIKKYKLDKINQELFLLKLGRVLEKTARLWNYIDLIAIKCMAISLGFLYDVYVKLAQVSYDETYLDMAESCEAEIYGCLIVIEGEK